MTLFQDIRFALRVLAKRPLFTAVAVLTLALGIGANTAIFSVLHSVVLEPLPFTETERLVEVWESRLEEGWERAGMNPANFWDFRDQNQTLEDLTALFPQSLSLTGQGFPERIDGATVSAGFFRLLGVRPVAGRTFLPGEDEPENDTQVALVAHDYWQRRFGGDPEVVGSALNLDGRSYTVVGVLPPGAPWLDAADVFIPMVRDPEAQRVGFYLAVIGRLKPGVPFESARADLAAVARRIEEQYPEAAEGIGVTLAPASEWGADGDLRRALWILLGAVGLLLLIACVNLANMLLAQATGRLRETALRATLGASRGRILRQLLTESLMLGLLGTATGLGLAAVGLRVLRALDPGDIPRLAQVELNGPVLVVTALAGILTGIVAGLVPALQWPQKDLTRALREGEKSAAGGRGQRRSLNVLVAAEVALSLVLLIGAGLLIRSFGDLMQVDRGFETDQRLLVAVDIPDAYGNERAGEVRERFLERLHGLPGVMSAAAVSMRPLGSGSTGMGFASAGWDDPEADVPWASWRLITGGYFETLGVPLVAGRTFNEHDIVAQPWRVIISQRLAERFWPGEDPIGKTAVLWKGQNENEAEIIGVVGNMRERGLENDETLATYLPYNGGAWSPVHFVIHTSGDTTPLVAALRPALAEIDPDLPISDVASMDATVHDSVAARRFHMTLLAVFAAVALVLALAGIYGVQAYMVSRRTAEIGVRVAMGARPIEILKLVVGQGMRPALLGIVLGLVGAYGLSRLMAGLLFGVEPSDPWTYAGAAVVFAAAALLSCYAPALRALDIDAMTALREE